MKKTLLFLSASLFLSWSANSQITNNGFEDWTSQGTYDEPDGWATLNFVAGFGLPTTVNKDTDAHGGTYSARLETLEANVFGSLDTLTGLMMLGTFDVLGAPYDQRPVSLDFYYKFSSPGDDYGQLAYSLTKWDDQNSTQAIIAEGTFELEDASSFTLMSIPIDYMSPEFPDSVQIIINSSGAAMPIPGTVLHIDDLEFILPVNSVADLDAQKPMVYPNPASDYLYVKTAGTKADVIEIRDLSGRLVEKTSIFGAGTKISLSQFQTGNYLYELKNGDLPLSRGQFNVIR